MEKSFSCPKDSSHENVQSVEEVSKKLTTFISKYDQIYTFEGFGSREDVLSFWNFLYNCLQNPIMENVHEMCLKSVRILSRDKSYLTEVITDEWIQLLILHAGLKINDNNSEPNFVRKPNVVIEALKCLCNLTYNSTKVQNLCSGIETLNGIVCRLRTYPESNLPFSIKYFDIKLLFLISALSPTTRHCLKEELHALTYLMEVIDFIFKEGGGYKQDNKVQYFSALDEEAVQLSCEILKVMFNLTIKEEGDETDVDDKVEYVRLVTILRELLLSSATEELHLMLCSNVVNLLTNMPIGITEMLMPQEDDEYNSEALDVIINFLHAKLLSNEKEKGSLLSPILTLLIGMAKHHKILRRHMRSRILPPLRDVLKKPEDGNSLRNMLCKLLTCPQTSLRDLVAEFLYVLCKEDVNRLIKYTGFGNAAGWLAQRGLLKGSGDHSPTIYSSNSEDSDTEEYKQYKEKIDVISGYYNKDKVSKPDPMASMTEEQKEYEAMQLVNMIDKLARERIIQPCTIGEDGRPKPVEHILELQEGIDKHLKKDDK